MGPHQMFGNFPRSIEYAVSWVTRLVEFCRDNGYTTFEATQQGVDEWTEHVIGGMKGFLGADVDSWMTGVNKNLAHRRVRTVARYNGSAIEFRKFCENIAQSGYRTLVFDGARQQIKL